MNDDAVAGSPGGAGHDHEPHPGALPGYRARRLANTSPRLDAYVDKTRSALDLFALLTLWIVLVPISDLNHGEVTIFALVLRLAISVVYAVDIGIRAHLAPHGAQYVRDHPLNLFAVIFPPIRVLFSLRLIQSLFQRGHLSRFMTASGILLLNGALLVYFIERDAKGANITTAGESLWWSIVTVTTVGYGNLYPVTAYGRVVSVFVMFIGLLTLAVVTAHVSASFNEQSRLRHDDLLAHEKSVEAPATVEATISMSELLELRDRIDALITASTGDSTAASGPSAGPTGGSPGGSPGTGDDDAS
ncbi:hypothetical protein BH10ACT3_BH10ACT3_24430 [soil metagenome]